MSQEDNKTSNPDSPVISPVEPDDISPVNDASMEFTFTELSAEEQLEYEQSQQQQVPAKPKRKLPSWLGPVVLAAAFIASKAKYFGFIAKAAKFKTFISMILMVAVYAQIWGWWFALGFVLLIFVHEMGHVLHLKKVGIKAGAPVFIPFVGAAIAMKESPPDAEREAFVGIGGPLWGGVAAAACFGVGVVTGNMFWYALSFTGFMLNIFNLIPMTPLDGGRIVAAVSRVFWLLGLITVLIFIFVSFNPILLLILVFGGMELYVRWRKGKEEPDSLYYKVPPHKRVIYGVAYLSLFAVLGVGMYKADAQLAPIKADPKNAPPFASMLADAEE